MPRLTSGARPSANRRNTMTRDDLPAVLAVAAAGAIAAAFAGCEPTGNPVADAVVTGSLAFFVAWAAATAPWWALVVAGGAAAVAGGWWVPIVLGVAAAVIALVIGDRRISVPALRSLSAALAVQGLLRLHGDPFFTSTALVAGVAMAIVAIAGIRRRPRPVRRRTLFGAAAVAGAAVLATALFGVAAASARSDVTAGYQGLLDGLDQLEAGEPQDAASSLHEASAQLAGAQDTLDAVWAQPARMVPVVAQHQAALAAIVEQASRSAEAAADALDVTDLDALTISQGRISVPALEILQQPLADLSTAVADLHDALADADSPWLLAPVAERLDRFTRRAADVQRQAATTSSLADLGPAILGADGPRQYFVGFASPAEARGTMGVMGNYAVLTVDDGRIERTAFGRINDLRNQLAAVPPFWLDASDEFRGRYEPYGLGGEAGGTPTSPSYLSNVTMTPDLPSAAPLVDQLWQEAGGDPLDGVILLDPAGIAALLEATGPITVDGLEAPLTAQNVEQFLLLDQYSRDTPERADLLEAVADATLSAVLDGSLPPPQELAQSLSPAAAAGHLLVWTNRPEEEALLRAVGVDGRLPELDGRDGLAVVNDNAGANKIDSFLEREITYDATYDATTGRVTGTVTVVLRNTAPATGYPDYVLRSEFRDIPPGTNRTLLTVFSPLDRTGALLDGEDVTMRNSSEQGWNASTLLVDLAPGQERTVVIDLDGAIAAGDYALVVRPQPLARDDAYRVSVGGGTDVEYTGPITRRTVLDANGDTAFR